MLSTSLLSFLFMPYFVVYSFVNTPIPNRLSANNSLNKTDLNVVMFTNYAGFIAPQGPICTEGIKIALEAVEKAEVLRNYNLVINLKDDYCDPAYGVYVITQFLDREFASAPNFLPFVIGPACGAVKFTGMMYRHYNVIGLAGATGITEIENDRKKYDSFSAVLPSSEMFFEAIPPFVQAQGWKRVYLLTEANSDWSHVENIMQRHFFLRNISVVGTSKVVVTGLFPEPELFQMAIQEVANSGAKIIILHTSFSAMIVCWLQRYGLFGPGYVYISYVVFYILPNSIFRDPFCTDQMIADVLKSIIFYHYGTPLTLDPANAIDEVGITGTYFESSLKARIGQPELDDKWFVWRGHCYDSIVAAAIALNFTETSLKARNDTLNNWLVTGENFKKNGKKIQQELRQHVEGLRYSSLNTWNRMAVNSKAGMTAFFQMQFDDKANITTQDELVAAFTAVPVATYDSSQPNAKLIHGPGRYRWKTHNGEPPFDWIRIHAANHATLSRASSGTLTALASLSIVVTLTLIGLLFLRRGTNTVSKSLPTFNFLILAGNLLMLSFILILPSGTSPTGNLNCMASSFFLVAGVSLVTTAILGKMQVANSSIPKNKISFKARFSTFRSQGTLLARPRSSMQLQSISPNTSHARLAPSLSTTSQISKFGITVSESATKHNKTFVFVWQFIQILLMAIWFGIEPIETAKFNLSLETSQFEVNVQYQYFTYSCQLKNGEKSVSSTFIVTLVSLYGLILLRSFAMAFALNRASVDGICDLNMTRMAAYSIGLIALAGGAVTGMFFADSPVNLHVALSSLALIVVSITTCVLFLPKVFVVFE